MKKSIALSFTALALIGLTACTDVRIAEDPQAEVTLPAEAPQAPSEEASATAEAAEPTETGDPTEESGSSTSGMVDNIKESASAAVGETISLGLETDKGTLYLRANQAFTPSLDRWVIDDKEVQYQKYTCVGKKTEEVYGVKTQVKAGSDLYDVEFDGLAPSTLMGGSINARLQITERTLGLPDIVNEPRATTNTEVAVNQFTDMCAETADTVAQFIF